MSSLTQRWVMQLMGELGRGATKNDLARALEACGRRCLPASTLNRAKAAAKGARGRKEKVAALARVWPHLEITGSRLAVTYSRCYCPIMRGYDGPPLTAFCDCSRGWIMAMFEQVIGEPVRVTAEKTVLGGGSSCRFRVTFAKK